MTEEIVFIELDPEVVSDKPHCGECEVMPAPAASDIVDKPHCGGCD